MATTLPCHYAVFPEPLNQSFELLLQKMRAVNVEITFEKKSHHTFNVSNTIYDIYGRIDFGGKHSLRKVNVRSNRAPHLEFGRFMST